MAIIIDQYQDSGPLLSGRGTTTTLINNVGWMNSGAAEGLTYADYPLIRPTIEPFTRSFTYYTFFKLSGTYVKGSRVRVKIAGLPSDIRIYNRLTDTYITPSSDHGGDLDYLVLIPTVNSVTLYPRLSTVGPNTGLSYPQYLSANTTYYTEYIKTQVYVEAGASYASVQNLFKCYVDEYEEDDL